MRVVLFFLDGVGLAPAGPANPLSTTPMPCLQGLLDGQALTLAAVGKHSRTTLLALDATLGVPGEPQSATGQTTLFTGINAPQAVGRHVRGFPTKPLRRLLQQEGLLQKVLRLGKTALFLNSYRPHCFPLVSTDGGTYSVTTWMNYYAGLPFHTLDDMVDGRGVCMDITNEYLRTELGCEVDIIAPEKAGRILAQQSHRVDFLLYEHFLTDIFAHKRDKDKITSLLVTIDRFLAGILAHLDLQETLLMVTSDHGNLEDLSTPLHTRNPVPLLLCGAGQDDLPPLADLTAVTPFILERLTRGKHG
ncbi:MAG: peptidase [Firmicutes bacterium]|nr:peptidase [Bacillota bacterium]